MWPTTAPSRRPAKRDEAAEGGDDHDRVGRALKALGEKPVSELYWLIFRMYLQGQLPCDRSDREASGIALPEIGLMKHHPVKSG